jgi:hypothetical protein
VGKRIKGKDGKAASGSKRVIVATEKEPPDRHLIWQFGRLDYATVFGCHRLRSEDAQELEHELTTFQGKLISTLRRKDWLKFVPIEDMTPDGRKALAQINKQESGLWQLHLHKYKWRVWGYFDHPKFYFLFWDAGHGIATGRSRRRSS